MKKIRFLFLALGLAAAGLLLAGGLLRKQVFVQIDEQPAQPYTTYAARIGPALAGLGVSLGAADWVSPTLESPVQPGGVIRIRRAYPVKIAADGQTYQLLTAEQQPAAWLEAAGVPLQAGDRIWAGAGEIAPAAPSRVRAIQVRRLQHFTLNQDGVERPLQTYAASLGQALWEAGILLRAGDRLEPAADTPIRAGLQATLQTARALRVQTMHGPSQIWSAAATVGQALAENGLALQGLDYTLPAEDQPLPLDGQVRLVRVREELQLAQSPLAFETVYQPSAAVELDSQQVITLGVYGVEVQPLRIYYEDGIEISRTLESGYLARPPQEQVIGYGTQVALRTLDTPAGAVQYYRAVQVYATSYSPCRSGGSRCYPGTSSGKPVTQGVIAVTLAWYRQLAGDAVYIPGYGFATIEDVGGGIPGRHWIDLGYTDDDFVPWSSWVTLYFLAPAPANLLWILP